jgi:siroheme synthase (precorrin-2 oxidase/ferrochelatase)
LLEERPEVEQVGIATGADAKVASQKIRTEAEKLGADAFHDLCARYQQRLKRELEKGEYAFQVRREALGRLGLPEVRQHRLKRLSEEEQAWAADLRKREQILPDLQPVILLRVEAGHG